MRLVRMIANLGYGSQREIRLMLADERITDRAGTPLVEKSEVAPIDVMIDGEPLDPPAGIVLMLHKPCGYTCSTSDPGRVIYEMLPARFPKRNPVVTSIGRLDRDTSGLLLLTDEGAYLHRIISPRSLVPKIYEAVLAQPLQGDEAARLADGSLLLRGETAPLAPAVLDVLDDRKVRLTITEGRYHQVRRMFAALGNRVESLHRVAVGGLTLGELAPGQWRFLDETEKALPFSRPDEKGAAFVG